MKNTQEENPFTCLEPLSKLSIHSNYEDEEYGEEIDGITFVNYKNEAQLESLMELVGRDLSEPYSIFTYRYFLHQWPELCILAVSTSTNKPIGCVVCKIDTEEECAEESGDIVISNNANKTQSTSVEGSGSTSNTTTPTSSCDITNSVNINSTNAIKSGYMAMLAVEKSHRRSGIGSALVRRIVKRMQRMGCASVTLETEVSNKAAMKLYEERLGFIREELLVRYYLNWGDAYRLRLWLQQTTTDDDMKDNEVGGGG